MYSISKEWDWATLIKDRAILMVAGFPDKHVLNKSVFTGSFYFRVDTQIDRLWEELSKKTKVCYSIETFEYGMREFAVYDNNGYILQFGQEVK